MSHYPLLALVCVIAVPSRTEPRLNDKTIVRHSACQLLSTAIGAPLATLAVDRSMGVRKVRVAGLEPTQPEDTRPRRPSNRTYSVRRLPTATIRLDGHADEPAWSRAVVEQRFIFPWKKIAPAPTKFRAFYDKTHLYFSFRIEDDDIVVLEELRDEEDAVFEDRAEMYFSRDDRMHDYFCAEVDSRGRVFDYHGSYYRQLDPAWNWRGLQASGARFDRGYVVEGRIPLKSFSAMGFSTPRPGVKIRCGLYRAEFRHDRSGRSVAQHPSIHNLGRRIDGPPPIEAWMSWVDPRTKEPDFHVPTSLGWLEFQP